MTHPQSSKRMKTLKAEVLEAVTSGRPDVIRSLLQGLPRTVIGKVLHGHSRCTADRKTPLTAAACWGHESIVRLLMDDFGIEPDSDVTLNSDGSPGLTALSCATERGHLRIAQFLLDKGADIDQVDHSHRTPLHRACQANMVEVATFLLKRGARTDIADGQGSTCLMTACQRGNTRTVELLLDSGADPNQRDHTGRTALHVAAETNAFGAAKLLLQHQAEIAPDHQGHTPLVTACFRNSLWFVHVVLASVPFTPEQTITTLELAGAFLADSDLDRAFFFLRWALIVRRSTPSSFFSPKPSCPPIAVLGHVRESRSDWELQSHRRKGTALQMECLLIAERVLGPDDPYTSSLFWKVCTNLDTHGHFHEAVAVSSYAMNIFSSITTKSDFDSFSFAVFVKMFQRNLRPRFSYVILLLRVRMEDLKHHATQEQPSYKTQFACIASSCLDYSGVALKVAASPRETEELQRLVERLIQVQASVQPQRSMLHVAVRKVANSLSVLGGSTPAVDLAALTAFLVQCGDDVDATDCEGNTPLHNIARLPGGADHGKTLSAVARVLLEAGAHVDVRNLQNRTPLDCAIHHKVKAVVLGHYPLSLRCQAASVAVQHQLSYSALLPGLATNFVHLHEQGQATRLDS